MQSSNGLKEDLTKQKSDGNTPQISPFEYYQSLRTLALQKRSEYGLVTHQISLGVLRDIYKREGIGIDGTRVRLKKLKAAYFNDSVGCRVLLNMNLPAEPRLFAMVHELKHHYLDSDRLNCICTEPHDKSPIVEIGAEVFAAEFLFPEDEFRQFVDYLGIKDHASPEDIVRLKYHSPAVISYQYIVKRMEWLKLVNKGEYGKVQFRNLHASMYGSPHYHQRIAYPFAKLGV